MITTKILKTAKTSFLNFVASKNRKAVKLGCPEIRVSFGESFFAVGDENGVWRANEKDVWDFHVCYEHFADTFV